MYGLGKRLMTSDSTFERKESKLIAQQKNECIAQKFFVAAQTTETETHGAPRCGANFERAMRWGGRLDERQARTKSARSCSTPCQPEP